MVDLASLIGARLRGGFLLKSVILVEEPMVDPIGRPALARVSIVGTTLEVELSVGMPDVEISISIYHEVLEGLAVAAAQPPRAVMQMNEADFESAAHRMQADFGSVSVKNLNRMLEVYGF